MEKFKNILEKTINLSHQEKLVNLINWTLNTFPELNVKVAWNQPMFVLNDTFIISYGVSQKHISVAPERHVINKFASDIKNAGYETSKELIYIPWKQEVDYELLRIIIKYNIESKKDYKTFWRKHE